MPMHLGRGVITLGAANGLDYAIQFLLPMILVRSLSSEAFGEYRLMWLLVNTIMALAPLYMPQSLFYFLPRVGEAAGRHVGNVLLFLMLSGILCALIVSAWNPFLPYTMILLPGSSGIIPLFVFLWVASSLLEWLPNANKDIAWQAKSIVVLSGLRVLLIGGAAFIFREIMPVFYALIAVAVLRLIFLAMYIVRNFSMQSLIPEKELFVNQLKYAAPFGLAGALYGMRQQAEQWIVAAMFSSSLFAIFSIAGVVVPLAGLIRQSVSNALLPQISAAQAKQDLPAAISLNCRANTYVAIVLLPILAFLFVFAEKVIALVYTSNYSAAAAPMRIVLVGLSAQVLVVNNILIVLAAGRFQMALNIVFLCIAVFLSWMGSVFLGLVGAALGSAISQFGSHLVSLQWVSQKTGIKWNKLLEWRGIAEITVSAVAAAMVARTIASTILNNLIITLAVGLLVCMLSFAALLMLTSQRRLVMAAAHINRH